MQGLKAIAAAATAADVADADCFLKYICLLRQATALALTRGAPLLQQRLLHAVAESGDSFNATQLAKIIYAFGA